MTGNFFKDEASRRAYIGKSAGDLGNLLTAQAAIEYQRRGMTFPVVASSTLSYLDKHPAVSLADVACALSQPHQVIAQRVASLKKVHLVEAQPDPQDGRRQLLALTTQGREQARLLDAYIEASQTAVESLSRDIGVDLPNVLLKAIESLNRKSFAERFDP